MGHLQIQKWSTKVPGKVTSSNPAILIYGAPEDKNDLGRLCQPL